MPIYEYVCESCGKVFDVITTSATKKSFREECEERIECAQCGNKTAKKAICNFKIGTRALDTSKQTGYETDDLTIGKIVDEGGIPYEFKDQLRKRDKRIKNVKKYTKELKKRAKKYKFDPFSDDKK
jgi:putative FmdB family regulatory protein